MRTAPTGTNGAVRVVEAEARRRGRRALGVALPAAVVLGVVPVTLPALLSGASAAEDLPVDRVLAEPSDAFRLPSTAGVDVQCAGPVGTAVVTLQPAVNAGWPTRTVDGVEQARLGDVTVTVDGATVLSRPDAHAAVATATTEVLTSGGAPGAAPLALVTGQVVALTVAHAERSVTTSVTVECAPAAPPADSADQAVVVRLYQDFLDRDPAPAELAGQVARLEAGTANRFDLAAELSRSDEWISVVVTGFYEDTLHRAPDAGGLAGWTAAARAGLPVAEIAASFYASEEYYRTVAGGDDAAWVTDLYRVLLLREPDAAGLDGWVRALGAGMSRTTLAYGFYQSQETLQVRVEALYQRLLGRSAEPGAMAVWTPVVRDQGDLQLAAFLAGSEEYYRRG
ncbi:DUF4214 domain-containing protein [Cellulomonas marina]|uniref:DUF4214 domain-containing protein n=1 Tax=Cellulomonas marina TaxID=988821 RepID=UPI00111391C2|nr:DUF4214 domain-containing protein [Cellulomonas marina]